MCLLGGFNVMLVYLYETLSSKYRWFGVLFSLSVGSTVSTCADILLAIPFLTTNASSEHWRIYIFIITLPFVIFIPLVIFFLEESPRYLQNKGDTDAALKVLSIFASQNNVQLSPGLNLIPESEVGATNDNSKLSVVEKVTEAAKSLKILRSAVSIVLIGIGCRFIFYSIGLAKTELVFLNQQGLNDYCLGSNSDWYLLQPEDYLNLFYFQFCGDIVAAFLVFAIYKANIGFKLTAIVCYSLTLISVCCLFLCPNVWVALSLLTFVYMMGVVFSIGMWLGLTGVFPTNIRNFMMGICTFLMYLPLPLAPFLIQTLSKESQHYVTSVILCFLCVGFVGSIILPNKELHSN